MSDAPVHVPPFETSAPQLRRVPDARPRRRTLSFVDRVRAFFWTAYGWGARDGFADHPRDTDETRYPLHGAAPGLKAGQDLAGSTDHEAAIVRAFERRIDDEIHGWERVRHARRATAKHVHDELREAVAELASHASRHAAARHELASRLMPALGWLMLLALGAFEFTFNFLAFAIVRVTRLETALLAVVPCACMVVAAHFAGKKLRQGGDTWRGVLLAVACVVGLGAGTIAIAQLRYLWVAHRAGGAADGSVMMQSVALGVLNAFLALAGIVVAYATTPKDEELARVAAGKARCRARVNRLARRLARIVARHDAGRGSVLARIDRHRDHALQCIHESRDANKKFRDPLSPPPGCFGEQASLALFRQRDVGDPLHGCLDTLDGSHPSTPQENA